jgi:hypothetical protein
MSNTKLLELRTLDDEDLMDVVGGGCQGQSQCQPQCQPQPKCYAQPCGGLDVDINVCVSICL